MKGVLKNSGVRFLFMYVSTDEIELELDDENQNLSVMGRNETMSFFGPVFSLYAAARSLKIK
jgi:hypothetical protein